MARRIIIFDTTLRDGEQCPGASLGIHEKLEIAHQLSRLRVDVIEGGFPVASPGDFEAVKRIAKEVKGPVICALARSLAPDIDRAAEALKPAKRKRIHVFLATSPIHRKYKLRKAKEEILKQAVWAVTYARTYSDDIEFSPEDASRTEPSFLHQVLEAVIAAGATTVNIPDTVGFAIPDEFGRLIHGIVDGVPNIDKAVISVHCHNDLGLSVPNSLAAIVHGAGQVECTMNGLGERAGNASLEEIVMALKTRNDFYQAETRVDTTQLYKSSRMVSMLTGMMVQPNKAIVGDNAFRHESGIHQDGVLKWKATYEILKPEDIGWKQSELVLGKHSGRHAFVNRLKQLGLQLKQDDLECAFNRFKELADKKKDIFDEDLMALVEEGMTSAPEVYRLDYVQTSSGSGTIPTATIRLMHQHETHEANASGDGPVDACYKAIDQLTGLQCELLDYALRGVTRGTDALGEVSVRLKSKQIIVTGRGASTDIIEASAKAYVNAINKILSRPSRRSSTSAGPALTP